MNLFLIPFQPPSVSQISIWVLAQSLRPYLAERAAYMRAWNDKNREHVLAGKRKSWARNRTSNIARGKAYAAKHKSRLQNYRREYYKEKRQSDPQYKLHKLIQRQVLAGLKGKSKNFRTQELIGCTFEELKIHIENQFKPGMSWENHSYSGWHVDHKVPRKAFDLTKIEELKRCYHFTNLQPLWAEENYEKSDYVSGEHGNTQPCLGI